jgi:hypothetical protein
MNGNELMINMDTLGLSNKIHVRLLNKACSFGCRKTEVDFNSNVRILDDMKIMSRICAN